MVKQVTISAKRVIILWLVILILILGLIPTCSADIIINEGNGTDSEDEESVTKRTEKSEGGFIFGTTFLIATAIIISAAFGTAILAVFWAIRKDRQRNANYATTNTGSGSKPGTIPGNENTNLAHSSELDSESEYHFPNPSDFDRPHGLKPNNYSIIYPNEYTSAGQFQVARHQEQIFDPYQPNQPF